MNPTMNTSTEQNAAPYPTRLADTFSSVGQAFEPAIARRQARKPAPQKAELRLGDGMIAFLGRRSGSEWLLLLFPVFLRAVYRRRGLDAVAEVDASAMLQVGMTAICGLYAVHRWTSAGQSLRRALTRTSLVWLSLYGLLAVVSAAWSGMPELTLFRGGQVLVYLVLAADALATLGTIQNLIRFQLCYAAVVCLTWQLPLLQYNFSLTALHSSQVPGAIVGMVFTGWMLEGRQWRMMHAFLIVMLLLGTSSATYVSVLGGLVVVLFTLRRRFALGVLLLGLATAMTVSYPQEIKNIVFYGKSEGNIRTASGRLPTWQWLVRNQMQDAPLAGYGFAFGEARARLYNIGGLRMQHMHSSVMSAFVNLGLLGLTLLVAYWLTVWRHVLRAAACPSRSLALGAVAAVCANSLSVESVTSPVGLCWIGHLLVFGMAVHVKQKTEGQ